MPIYAYQCPQCQSQIERLQKLSDPNPNCEHCNTLMTKRLTAAGFQFKGSGYYVTDFRDPPAKAPATESAAPAACQSGACGCAATPVAPPASTTSTPTPTPATA